MQTAQIPKSPTAEVDTSNGILNGTNRTCLTCGHVQICSAFRGITRFMSEFQKSPDDPENLLFESYQIGKICKKWTTKDAVEEGDQNRNPTL